MQVPKDNIRRRILSVARQEFIRRGVKGTSVQCIARLSGIAVGNVYNYFHSKSEIYVEVLTPLLHELEHYLKQEQSEEYQTVDFFYSDAYSNLMIERMLSIVKRYRAEFKLLMFESAGTPLENFFDQYADAQAQMSYEYLMTMKEKYPQINSEISPLFVKANCGFWFYVLKMIIRDDEISEGEVQALLSDFIHYGRGGWKSLLNI